MNKFQQLTEDTAHRESEGSCSLTVKGEYDEVFELKIIYYKAPLYKTILYYFLVIITAGLTYLA